MVEQKEDIGPKMKVEWLGGYVFEYFLYYPKFLRNLWWIL